MYWEAPTGELAVPVSGVSRIAIAAMMAAIVVFGIYPQPIVNALRP
jgi:NADH:ubiquinone oxidoreductase subunit 4 (subunit M)